MHYQSCLSQKERRRHNICVRTNRNLLNLSALFDGILIELFWAPGSHNAADLSSKVITNLAKILNSSFYRHGHCSYSAEFPSPEAILFATIHSGVLRFRGLTSLSNHTSACHFCSTQYSDKVGKVLTFHTELLGKSETDKTLKGHNSYSDILAKANEILSPNNCETTSVGLVRKTVFGKDLYLSMLARFSSIYNLITGLACIMCRVRKVNRENAGN